MNKKKRQTQNRYISQNTGQNSDNSSFIQFLDQLNTDESVQKVKRQSYGLLQISPGVHLLDVGCGTGEDVRTLAKLVGSTGRVVGVDVSESMIIEAKNRYEGSKLPIEFHVGDANHLDFPNNTFNGCRADLTFQNLTNPQQALTELVRVAKSGARIVLSEPDWETLLIDSSDFQITRKILNFICDEHPHGWLGRQLPRFFRDVGLEDIKSIPVTSIGTDYTQFNQRFRFQPRVKRAQEAEIITETEATTWLNQLKEFDRLNRFFWAHSIFIVSGRKP